MIRSGPPPYRVAIIGVGNMGGAIARRLLRLGWELNVCDVVAQRMQPLQDLGARACADPAEAVRNAQVSIVAVVDALQCQTVLFGGDGLIRTAASAHTVMLCPTLAPPDVVSMGASLQAAGLSVLESPMSGGPLRAEDGTMTLMLCGAQELLDRHARLLQDLAAHRHWIGGIYGDGAKTKLVNNLAAAILLLGTSEALALAKALGLDPATTLDVMEQSSGQSWIGSDRMRRHLSGDLAPRAHMSLLAKDTRLALEAARSVDFSAPLGETTRDLFAKVCAFGWSEHDDGALFKWLSESMDP